MPRNYNTKAYNIDLILDPCRNKHPGCCMDQYGGSEYIRKPYKRKLGRIFAISHDRVSDDDAFAGFKSFVDL